MFKFHLQFTKHQYALPLAVGFDDRKAFWVAILQVLCFQFQIIHINVPKPEEIAAPVTQPAHISPTKAYADERQKTKRNRRRKPSKAMKNLYQLS